MLQISAQAAIAAPAPARTSDLDFAAFIRPATDFLDFPGCLPSCPFPNWDPTAVRHARFVEPAPAAPEWSPFPDDEIERTADRLAWRNDHESNDDENYPGPEWTGDVYEPDAEDVALYECVALGEHWKCGCRHDLSNHEAYEADRWFDDEFGGDWHEAELVRSGRGPLNPVVGGHVA